LDQPEVVQDFIHQQWQFHWSDELQPVWGLRNRNCTTWISSHS